MGLAMFLNFITVSAIIYFYNLKSFFLTALFLMGFFITNIFLYALYQQEKTKDSLNFINAYNIPSIVLKKFRQNYPNLDKIEEFNIIKSLKQFFMIYAVNCRNGSKESYAMPSKVADDLWHEFMLCSKEYNSFCMTAFGKFLHHAPSENEAQIPSQIQIFSKDLLATYTSVKKLKSYKMYDAIGTLPALFALDSSMKITDGFNYDETIIAKIEAQIKTEEAKRQQSSSSCSSCSSGSSCGCSSGCGGGCGS